VPSPSSTSCARTAATCVGSSQTVVVICSMHVRHAGMQLAMQLLSNDCSVPRGMKRHAGKSPNYAFASLQAVSNFVIA
jgi:hypothetical protein